MKHKEVIFILQTSVLAYFINSVTLECPYLDIEAKVAEDVCFEH